MKLPTASPFSFIRASRSGGGTGLALVLVLCLAGAAVAIALNARAGRATSRTTTTESPRRDIFADLPPDVPKARRGSSDGSGKSRGSSLSKVELPTDEEAWNQAQDYAKRAKLALQEAIAAQDAGARDLAKKKGSEAQELYSRALQSANPWLEALAEQFGRDDPLVQRVDRITSGWAREVMALKKSAGM